MLGEYKSWRMEICMEVHVAPSSRGITNMTNRELVLKSYPNAILFEDTTEYENVDLVKRPFTILLLPEGSVTDPEIVDHTLRVGWPKLARYAFNYLVFEFYPTAEKAWDTTAAYILAQMTEQLSG